jgi:hypothetical protein
MTQLNQFRQQPTTTSSLLSSYVRVVLPVGITAPNPIVWGTLIRRDIITTTGRFAAATTRLPHPSLSYQEEEEEEEEAQRVHYQGCQIPATCVHHL